MDYLKFLREGGTPGHVNKRAARPVSPRPRLPRTPEVLHALGVLADARGQQEGKQGYIYLIGERTVTFPVQPDFVKVGFSTKPEARVTELQSGNPRELYLIAAIEGDEQAERALHIKYAADNVLGEWFILTPELLAEFTDVAEPEPPAVTALGLKLVAAE